MPGWRRVTENSTFWPALTGALILGAAFPLPSWFRWLGPFAPNVDTGVISAEGYSDWPGPAPWYLSLAHLAWLAPVPWIWLIRRERLPGRHPYLALWTVGFLYWLVQLYWLTLPYWATSLGWLALAWYLAFYLPVFVGLCRVAVHRFRMPVILAAPVVWTGLELARGHLLTGFTMCSLGHTQYRWLGLIQVADLVGAYGLGFVMMFVAACLGRMWPVPDAARHLLPVAASACQPKAIGQKYCLWPILPAACLLTAVLVYGQSRLQQERSPLPEAASPGLTSVNLSSVDQPTASPFLSDPADSSLSDKADPSPGSARGPRTSPGRRSARIALIQGSIDTKIKDDPQKQTLIMEQYIRLSQEAIQRFGRVDLLIWPETMFRVPWVTWEEPIQVPEDWQGGAEEFRRYVEESVQWGRRQVGELARSLGVPVLLGIDGVHIGPQEVQFFNTALFVDAQGNPIERYDKMHPVLFGEYVPLAKRIRFLQHLTPLGPGLTEGQRAVAVPVGEAALRVSPTICYESVLPHVVRRAILMLRSEGKEPDAMANLTNDGWFYGSIELDLHLICGVFRAVEFRKPWVIAANTGFSAWIDGSGRIRCLGPRRSKGVLLAEIQTDPRRSFYLDYGDWFAGICLAATGLVALGGILGTGLLGRKWSPHEKALCLYGRQNGLPSHPVEKQ